MFFISVSLFSCFREVLKKMGLLGKHTPTEARGKWKYLKKKYKVSKLIGTSLLKCIVLLLFSLTGMVYLLCRRIAYARERVLKLGSGLPSWIRCWERDIQPTPVSNLPPLLMTHQTQVQQKMRRSHDHHQPREKEAMSMS